MSNPKDIAYSQAVVGEKQRLFALADGDLLALPAYSTVEKTVAGVELSVGIYHHSHPDGFKVFVAQAKRQIFLGYGYMFVEGFILRHDGSRGTLPDHVYYEYS